ncbi:MAG: hypothetical protein WC477_04190 [Patescibacteria group bacterium]
MSEKQKATLEQYLQLGQMIKTGALDRETVQAILGKRFTIQNETKASTEIRGYIVSIDLSLTLTQMIKAGKYNNHKNAIASITEECFPVDRTGTLQHDKELFLVPPSRDGITTTEWKEELEADWVLEQTPELLALGAKYPALQLDNYIIAFGSSWRSPGGGCLGSPVLWSHDGERKAGTFWYDLGSQCSLHNRALVSRKPDLGHLNP